MNAQAVFFDLDDTLCDFTSAWNLAISEVHTQTVSRFSGLEAPELQAAWEETWAEQLAHLALPGETMARVRDSRFQRCLSKLGISDDEFANEVNLKLGYRMLEGLKLFSDAQVLEPLRATWPTAIVTNGADDSHPDSQRSKAEHLGLINLTDGFFASDSWGMRKPGPHFLVRCAEEMGLEPGRVIYVGDSIDSDVVGANRAGMTSVLIWRSQRPVPDLNGEQRPRVVIHSLTELLNWTEFN